MRAHFAGTCALCLLPVTVGEWIQQAGGAWLHQACAQREPLTRTIGVQSACHYTWHNAVPRFQARNEGFARADEVGP